MEYEVLDSLKLGSDARIEKTIQANPGTYIKSEIIELDEPLVGSNKETRLFIYKNFMSLTGLVNLAIVITEHPKESDADEGLLGVEATVDTSIFPMHGIDFSPSLYLLPEKTDEPNITPERAKFIIDKRSLPKMKMNEEFDENKHRWSVNKIAQALNMSNRIVAKYVKAKNI